MRLNLLNEVELKVIQYALADKIERTKYQSECYKELTKVEHKVRLLLRGQPTREELDDIRRTLNIRGYRLKVE